MNKTKIEWVKNPDGTQGYTWNPITGCLNGCPYCYARKLANGRLRSLYQSNTNVAPLPLGMNYIALEKMLGCKDDELCDHAPFYPRFWSERFKEFHRDMKQPKGIFVCDMGELFGAWIPKLWQERVFNEIVNHPQHRFYLLTKQPQNLIKFSPFPDNCWVGVTATNYEQYFYAVQFLAQIDAKIKFISFEPLLERLLDRPLNPVVKVVDWVIIGAQTKPYKPPKLEWVEEICQATRKVRIPTFLKDNLRPIFNNHVPWWALQGWGYRQEMPK